MKNGGPQAAVRWLPVDQRRLVIVSVTGTVWVTPLAVPVIVSV
jgi:hypothetical protein